MLRQYVCWQNMFTDCVPILSNTGKKKKKNTLFIFISTYYFPDLVCLFDQADVLNHGELFTSRIGCNYSERIDTAINHCTVATFSFDRFRAGSTLLHLGVLTNEPVFKDTRMGMAYSK